MRQDFSLRELYQHSPSLAVSEEVFPGLTKRERTLLIKRDSGSIQIAAKGVGIARAENQALLSALFTQKPQSWGSRLGGETWPATCFRGMRLKVMHANLTVCEITSGVQGLPCL